MLFTDAGYSRTTTEMTSSVHSLLLFRVEFVLLTRTDSKSGNPEPSMSTKVWNTLKSVLFNTWFIKAGSFLNATQQYSMWLRPRLTHRSESWSWGSRRSWGSPGAWVTLSTVSLYAWDSLRQFLFYILYWTCLQYSFCYSVSNLISFRSRVTWGSWEAWRPFRTLCLGDNNGSTLTIHHHIHADKKPFISW